MEGVRLVAYVFSPWMAWAVWCLGPRRWLIERRARRHPTWVCPRYPESERT